MNAAKQEGEEDEEVLRLLSVQAGVEQPRPAVVWRERRLREPTSVLVNMPKDSTSELQPTLPPAQEEAPQTD